MKINNHCRQNEIIKYQNPDHTVLKISFFHDTNTSLKSKLFLDKIFNIYSPLINAESVENRLKNTVFRNWKDIQRQCRNQDRENTGTITVEQPVFFNLFSTDSALIKGVAKRE
jgi:hypothetical protein